VALTSLYPPNFYNSSPMASKADASAPASSPSAIYQDPFPTTVHHQRPVGMVLAARVAPPNDSKLVSAQPRARYGSSSTAVTAREVRPPASVWQHALGGAVVLPLATQVLFPPAVAGRFVATASLLAAAAAGAAASALSDLLVRIVAAVRRRLLLRAAAFRA
jgi:hypothetical protein